MRVRQVSTTEESPGRPLRSLFSGPDRRRADGRGTIWSRRIPTKGTITVLGTALGVAIAAAIKQLGAGESVHSVTVAAATVDSTITALDGRAATSERRIEALELWRVTSEKQNDSLRFELRQTNQYLCIITRKIDPTVAGPDCSATRRR